MISPERYSDIDKAPELVSMDNSPARAGRPSSILSGGSQLLPAPVRERGLASKMSILSATGNDNAYTRGAAEAEWASMASPRARARSSSSVRNASPSVSLGPPKDTDLTSKVSKLSAIGEDKVNKAEAAEVELTSMVSPPVRAGSPSSVRSDCPHISLGPPKDTDLASEIAILSATGNDNGYTRGAAELRNNQKMIYLWDKQGWEGHSTWHKKLLGPESCNPIDPSPFYRPPAHAYEPNEAYAWSEPGQRYPQNRGFERGHCYGPNPVNDNDDPRQVCRTSIACWIPTTWFIWIVLVFSSRLMLSTVKSSARLYSVFANILDPQMRTMSPSNATRSR